MESLINNEKRHHKSQQPIVLMLSFTPEEDREYTIVHGRNRCEVLVEFLDDKLAVRASHVVKDMMNDDNVMKDGNVDSAMKDVNVVKGLNVNKNNELKFSDLNLENPSVIRHVALPVEIFVPV